jgi:L-2-amino-thiazoline-4-carboxylic acid hydrolase
LYCLADDWLMENLPASIKWERTKTLARGNELCDFRWSQGIQINRKKTSAN